VGVYVEDEPESVDDCFGEGWGCVFLFFACFWFFLSLSLSDSFISFFHFVCVSFDVAAPLYFPSPLYYTLLRSSIRPPAFKRTGAYLPISFLGTPIYFYFRVLHNGCTCGFALPRGDYWVPWALRPEVVWGGEGFLFGSHDDGVGTCACAFSTRAASGA
jgi:hypothetical protein